MITAIYRSMDPIKTAADGEDIPVSWQLDGIQVNASLTHPEGRGPFPAVVMVAGGGPTDRNWNSPMIPGTNGSARLLARALTDAGYITLRYDKRASGPQGKQNSVKMAGKISMQSHLEELAGGVRLLAQLAEVDPGRIYALTNSEGCIHAMHYQIQAGEPPFAGLILTSAPARPIGAVAQAQIEAQLKPAPEGEQWLAAYEAAMADFTAGRDVSVDETLPEGLRATILGITSPINQPFARELWVTDPAALLAKIRVPVLILIGKKDIQVDWMADGPIFEAAARQQEDITPAYAENANHVLKYEPRRRATLSAAEATNSYNAETSVLDRDSLEIIEAWLRDHAQTPTG